MNKFFTLLTLIMGMCCAEAQIELNANSYVPDENHAILIWHKDGSKTEVALNKEPRITFNEEELLIQSPMIELAIPKKELLKYTFGSTTETSNETIQVEENRICIDESYILIQENVKVSEVAVYDLLGHKLPVSVQQTGEEVQVSIFSLPSNIYVLKCGQKSIKFRKL